VATLVAHLTLINSLVFAAGLLAGMVPEGLLPVITLALAVAVRQLAGRGALVKRLSAVETLGCTDVICTDKTGTLTENRMIPVAAWVPTQRIYLEDSGFAALGRAAPSSVQELGRVAARCNNALFNEDGEPAGDPTEIAILAAARTLGADTDHGRREAQRRWQFHFDPERKLMSTVDQLSGESIAVHTKGAPEAVLSLCSWILDAEGHPVPLDDAGRRRVEHAEPGSRDILDKWHAPGKSQKLLPKPPLDEACPDIDRVIRDAAEVGRMAVECCIEPLREILADLPRIISIEVKQRHPERFASEWDI